MRHLFSWKRKSKDSDITENKFIEVERQESFIERCDPHADVSLQEVKDKETYLREFSEITSRQ